MLKSVYVGVHHSSHNLVGNYPVILCAVKICVFDSPSGQSHLFAPISFLSYYTGSRGFFIILFQTRGGHFACFPIIPALPTAESDLVS